MGIILARALRVFLVAAAALCFAGLSSGVLAYLMTPREMRACATEGHIVLIAPTPESVVKVMERQCSEALQRASIMSRYEMAHPLLAWPVWLVGFLLDPISAAMVAVFTFLLWAAFSRVTFFRP